jgi:hypothetical protein
MFEQQTERRNPPMILVGLCMVIGVLGALVALPFAAVGYATGRLRLRRWVRRMPCPECNGELGQRSLALPAELRDSLLAEAAKTKDFSQWKLARKVVAVCPGCGACFSFDNARRGFVVVPLRFTGTSAQAQANATADN